MAPLQFDCVLLPRSPRKRKASRTPSRASSPNLSPTKKIRRDKDVDATTSTLSNFTLSSRTSSNSSTVSVDFGELDEIFSAALDPDDASDIVFHDEHSDYFDESQLPNLLSETSGRGLPIRCLQDFILFRRDNLKMISAMELLVMLEDDIPDLYGAAGVVTAVEEGSENEAANDELSYRVKGLEIIGFSVHDLRDGDTEVDENVYIKTTEAWYLLGCPESTYSPFWAPFWIRQQLAHRIITFSFEDSEITYEQFIEYLDDQEDEDLNESAFTSDEVVAYIMHTIERVLLAGACIKNVPLIKTILKHPPPVASPAKPAAGRTRKKKDSDIFATPVVGWIVNQHLVSPVSVVGEEYERTNKLVADELHKVLVHHEDPESTHWGMESSEQGFYSSVILDGIIYKVGDVVAVSPGDDENEDRAGGEKSATTHCINVLANNAWFCQILYFFDHPRRREENGEPVKMFHGQWFLHGSRTLLQEVSHSQSLFLLYECDDLPVASILQKCQVDFLGNEDLEERDRQNPDARTYFCQYSYDEDTHAFVGLPTTEERDRLGAYQPLHKPCISCGVKEEKRLYDTVRVLDHGLAQYGRVYHELDFVYVKPDVANKTGLCLFVAQIRAVDLEKKCLRVRYYERDQHDPRLVSRTSRTNKVNVDDLDGLCFVREFEDDQRAAIETWLSDNLNHFYVFAYDEPCIQQCIGCLEEHCAELERAKLHVLRCGQARVLEVFSGAGGLSQGLSESGFFRTKWAVEKYEPAAETFRLNHPESKVLCADINALLQYVVDRRDGKEPSPLISSDAAGTEIPDDHIPALGEADVLCGGPPCQSFSGANGQKYEGDPRSALPFTMLSMAELYRPKYFLLENVTGMLGHAETSQRGRGKIEKVMVKLIPRILMALGNQVRSSVLEAAQHGSPQGRNRLLFWAAQLDYLLPTDPIPMFAFRKAAVRRKLFNENSFLSIAKRGRGEDDDHIFAPHAGVTIADATSDLPSFDWENPHETIAEKPRDVRERNERLARGIKQFDASQAPVGFSNPVAYATVPTTRYQLAMRYKNLPKVSDHFTDQATPSVVEAVNNVPLVGDANHRSLPGKILRSFKTPVNRHSKYICFGRLDNAGQFKTAMTTVSPRSRGSCVLHPTQHRAISVAEAKRCQGFPDHFILWSDKRSRSAQIKDYYKHVGNAVPVPLAAAIGRSIQTAFVETMALKPREESPEL